MANKKDTKKVLILCDTPAGEDNLKAGFVYTLDQNVAENLVSAGLADDDSEALKGRKVFKEEATEEE